MMADGPSRRVVLFGAGALVVGCALPSLALASGAPTPLGAFVRIDGQSRVQIICPASEMGQGVHDSLARLVAEELGCDWARVEILQPWADAAFVNPASGKQRTANSDSIQGYFTGLRKAGAAARDMLRQAAAASWQVPADSVRIHGGLICHSGSSRTLAFGDMAEAAARLPVPASPVLKSPDAWQLIGKRLPRKDIPAKVNGTATFGMDVKAPDMLTAALVLGPHPGAKILSHDSTRAAAMPGVVAIVPVDGGVAVVADSYWRAAQAAATVVLVSGPSPSAGIDDAAIAGQLARAIVAEKSASFPEIDTRAVPTRMIPPNKAAVASALADAARISDVEYDVPYLAHAALEPLCCTALYSPDGLRIIGPLQAPEVSRQEAARVSGLPIEKIHIDITFIGGGFGRKWATDFVNVAVQAAMGVPGRMVKTVWNRAQDFAVDQFRPAYRVRTRTALGKDGEIQAMHSRIAGQSIWRSQGRPQVPGMADPSAAGLLIYDRYDFPNKLIDFVEIDPGLSVGYWRGVTFSQNVFFAESAIDEAAIAGRVDPYLFRRRLLAGDPRTTVVLDKAAAMIGWSDIRPAGTGVGIALSYTANSFCAQAAEVEITGRTLVIKRIVCAFDCGVIVDPGSVDAQINGGIVFGLQAALWGEIGFVDGMARAENFGDFRMPTLADVPPIEVALITSDAAPGGCGEAGSPPIAAALTNAIAAATGQRVRSLPLSRTFAI